MNNKFIYKISLLLVSVVFLIGIVIGLYFDSRSYNTNQFLNPKGLDYLILNNLKANLLIASGFLTFGLGTVIYLIFNGAVLGNSIQVALKFQNMEISEVILGLLPHGIFEIPAMLISGLIGFQTIEYLVLFFSNNTSTLIKDFLKQLILRILVVLILTTLAGIIEWYITFKFFKGDYLQ